MRQISILKVKFGLVLSLSLSTFACKSDFDQRIKKSKSEGYDFHGQKSAALPHYLKRTYHPTWDVSSPEKVARVDSIELINHDDQKVDQSAFRGKPSLVFFFFAQCTTFCPTIMLKMAKLTQALPSTIDYQIIGITVDIERDRPEKLKKYLEHFKKGDTPAWVLMNPVNQQTLDQLSREVFPIVLDDSKVVPGDFIHSERVFLVDANGYVRGAYNSTSVDLAVDLSKALASLEAEKSMMLSRHASQAE